ncbi:MAG: type III toxin-antitoxin system ToxN/AbiQ family toxin [Lachnospiraceae bacterium]|nr:type III toxin-antitoxin system ToxN/AbiQ family toxin [Lachnospiraceae bacterium]
MDEFKLYVVSLRYIEYLRQYEPTKILSSIGDHYVHDRKYLGIVYSIGGYNFFAPFSSPKNSDYTKVKGERKIRKSIVPIIRMTETKSDGSELLLGTIKLNNMIPVPETELTLYDVDNESDLHYKILIQKEIQFVRKNKEKIFRNAGILYKQRINNMPGIGYLQSTADFALLQKKYDEFVDNQN